MSELCTSSNDQRINVNACPTERDQNIKIYINPLARYGHWSKRRSARAVRALSVRNDNVTPWMMLINVNSTPTTSASN